MRQSNPPRPLPSPGALRSPAVAICIGFLVLALSFGARALLGLGMPTWTADFHWTKTAMSGVGAIALCVMAAVVSFSGYASDRWGARGVLALGCTALGGGLAAVAAMDHLWQLTAGYAIGGGIGFGLASLPVVGSMVVRRAVSRQGLATGLATAGATAGPLILLPLMAWLFGVIGWRTAIGILAGACIAAMVLVWLLIEREAPSIATDGKRRPGSSMPLRGLIRSRAFHGLFWSFTLCGFTSTGVVETHLIPFAEMCGFATLPSTAAYSVFAASNFAGMLLAGHLCDRMDRRNLLLGIYIVRALALVIPLFVGSNYGVLLAFSVMVGLAFYATFPATIGLSAAYFGKENVGAVLGILTVGHALGAASGAFASGYLVDVFMKYDWAWVVSIGVAGAAGAFTLLLVDPRTLVPSTGIEPVSES